MLKLAGEYLYHLGRLVCPGEFYEALEGTEESPGEQERPEQAAGGKKRVGGK